MKKKILYWMLFVVFMGIFLQSIWIQQIYISILCIIGIFIVVTKLYDSYFVTLQITKQKLQRFLQKKELSESYIVLIELKNLAPYSQFYDLSIEDKIIKNVYDILQKKYHEQVYLYQTNQLLVLRESTHKSLQKQRLRYEEQYRICSHLKHILEQSNISINKNDEFYQIEPIIGCASVGMQQYETKWKDVITLAHYALIQAKEKNQSIVIAVDELRKYKQDLDQFNNRIKDGLPLHEFHPYFLPVFDSKNLTMVGCETLLRWERETYNIIEAGKFKDIAIEKNLFHIIDEHVIEESFKVYQNWKNIKCIPDTFRLTINICKQTLLTLTSKRLLELVKKYDIRPSNIEVDISENDLNDKRTRHAVKRLKQSGFHISIDAFKHDSLSLQIFLDGNVDTIKIDKSRLEKDDITKEQQRMYKVITTFAHIMNYNIVAKGIEHKKHLTLARELRVPYVQGYYFTPPLNYEKMTQFFSTYDEGKLVN